MKDVELGEEEGGGAGEILASRSNLNLNGGGDGCVPTEGKSSQHEGCIDVRSSGDGAPAPATAASADKVLSIVATQPADAAALDAEKHRTTATADGDDGSTFVPMTTVKIAVTRSDSYQEQCRVCQELSDEPLMELGCGCRGELAKVHKSCIEIWFGTRGSNKCEICQQIAVNVPLPESHPGTNYWIWRVDPAYGISNVGNPENQRRSFNPIWIAFCILIGGLLLDVFVSISFGISALPVNIIIGALILLGLGTALRLALKCRSDWNTRRFVLQRTTGVAPPQS